MTRLASGHQWVPHLKLVDGRWIVKWRAPFPKFGPIEDCWKPYIEVFESSVHFMTKSTERGRLARAWCHRRNAPWNCHCTPGGVK